MASSKNSEPKLAIDVVVELSDEIYGILKQLHISPNCAHIQKVFIDEAPVKRMRYIIRLINKAVLDSR